MPTQTTSFTLPYTAIDGNGNITVTSVFGLSPLQSNAQFIDPYTNAATPLTYVVTPATANLVQSITGGTIIDGNIQAKAAMGVPLNANGPFPLIQLSDSTVFNPYMIVEVFNHQLNLATLNTYMACALAQISPNLPAIIFTVAAPPPAPTPTTQAWIGAESPTAPGCYYPGPGAIPGPTIGALVSGQINGGKYVNPQSTNITDGMVVTGLATRGDTPGIFRAVVIPNSFFNPPFYNLVWLAISTGPEIKVS